MHYNRELAFHPECSTASLPMLPATDCRSPCDTDQDKWLEDRGIKIKGTPLCMSIKKTMIINTYLNIYFPCIHFLYHIYPGVSISRHASTEQSQHLRRVYIEEEEDKGSVCFTTNQRSLLPMPMSRVQRMVTVTKALNKDTGKKACHGNKT